MLLTCVEPQLCCYFANADTVCHALDVEGVRRKHGACDNGVLQRWGMRPDDGFMFMSLGLHWGSVPASCLPKRMLGAGDLHHTCSGIRTTRLECAIPTDIYCGSDGMFRSKIEMHCALAG